MSRVQWLRKTMLWRGMAALVKGLTQAEWGERKLQRSRRVRPRLEILEGRLAPAAQIFTVTSTTDDGTGAAGTLSAAINGANANPGSTIQFDLPDYGTAEAIFVSGALPAITQPTSIMGSSQASNQAGVWVGLDGAGVTGNGLTVDSGGVTIEGLAIYGFTGNGILLNNLSGGDLVVSDNIGTDVTGTREGVGNAGAGVGATGETTRSVARGRGKGTSSWATRPALLSAADSTTR
jgi:hypothetical protein